MKNTMQSKQGETLILGLLAVLILLLAACGRVPETNPTGSPVPQVTFLSLTSTVAAATPTPLPTGTPRPATSVPFAFETPTPIYTPAVGADLYRLKEWDAEAALGLVHIAEQYSFANNIPMPIGEKRFNYQMDQSLIKLAAQEALYRFPNDGFKEKLEWRIALADAIMDISDSDEWILQELEAALNDGSLTPDTLDQKLLPYGFEVRQREGVPNLFGDGQPGYVLWITDQDRGLTGLYAAVHRDDLGEYAISKIYSTWDFNFGYDEPFKVEDHTGDGIPEIILSPGYHNGSFCGYELLLFQRRDDYFADLSQGQLRFDLCGSIEESWKYVSSDEGTAESIETLHAANFFARVIRHDTFDWNGEQYELVNSWLEVPERFDLAASSWIIHAMNEGEYQTVIEKVGEFIADRDQLQTMRSELGEAYPDYLRFQLGLAHAFQSNEAEARSFFEQVSQTPQSLDSLTLSKAAQAYLEDYHGDIDLYRSCQSALQVMEEAAGTISTAPGSDKNELLKQAWGYRPDDAWDSLAVCSLSSAFREVTARIENTDFANAPDVLSDAGVLVRSASELDLDSDGKEEWVVLVDTPGDDAPLAIWILRDTQEGVHALSLVSWERSRFDLPSQSTASPMEVKTEVSPEGKSMVLLRVGSYLYIFRLDDSREAIEWLLYGIHDVEGYTIDRQEGNPVLEVTINTEICPHCQEIYTWSGDGFEWQIPGEPAKARVDKAEAALLEQWQPQEAIPLLQSILDEMPSPRLMYLLGLSYEMAGEEEQAVQRYWELWHTHPESPYASLAQAKLALKE